MRRRVRFFAWESLPESPEFDIELAARTIAGLDDANWRYQANDVTTAAILDRLAEILMAGAGFAMVIWEMAHAK